jgi:hypothetical protein
VYLEKAIEKEKNEEDSDRWRQGRGILEFSGLGGRGGQGGGQGGQGEDLRTMRMKMKTLLPCMSVKDAYYPKVRG